MIGNLHARLIRASQHVPEIKATAVLGSPLDDLANVCYRYELCRYWDYSKPTLIYVMLNPSTADAYDDDPTIRVCMGRASMMGYGSIRVVNLFAYRSWTPDVLYDHVEARNRDYVVGPENDEYIHRALEDTETGAVLCAWGNHGTLIGRGRAVELMIRAHGYDPLVIALTKTGQPCHPLRQSYNMEAVKW